MDISMHRRFTIYMENVGFVLIVCHLRGGRPCMWKYKTKGIL